MYKRHLGQLISPSAIMSKPVLGYWNLRGLCQPIRFLFAFIGCEVEEKIYTIENGEAWAEDKFNLGLDLPNLPYLIDGDVNLTETRAILKYFAREKGQGKNLIPDDPQSSRTLDMLENFLWDIWTSLLRLCYGWNEANKIAFEQSQPPKFEQLSKYLGKKKYLYENQMTYVDFILYELLFAHNSYDADFLKPYPSLEAFKTNFESIPEIVAFINSPQYIATKCTSPLAAHPI